MRSLSLTTTAAIFACLTIPHHATAKSALDNVLVTVNCKVPSADFQVEANGGIPTKVQRPLKACTDLAAPPEEPRADHLVSTPGGLAVKVQLPLYPCADQVASSEEHRPDHMVHAPEGLPSKVQRPFHACGG